MAVIRIGRIDNFKGADTVLIEADAEGVKVLAAFFRTLSTGVQSRAEVHNWPSARSYGAITLLAERFPDDAGLIERRRGEVVWRRSAPAWAQIAEQVLALEGASSGHQYLEGPADNLQVIAAIGEYGEPWWANPPG